MAPGHSCMCCCLGLAGAPHQHSAGRSEYLGLCVLILLSSLCTGQAPGGRAGAWGFGWSPRESGGLVLMGVLMDKMAIETPSQFCPPMAPQSPVGAELLTRVCNRAS
jgi:hypothetical protein